ncbi:MAG: DUF4445 domain-containing protein [Anaerolineales bacterium]|nr:DUF4445 domain-containing protein [Anaerolineales bacterium]
MTFEVDFEPLGRRLPCQSGETVLAAAQRLGLVLNATCGGEGVCGRCLVRIMAGQASPPTPTEEAELGGRIANGWRLACQAEIQGDLRVHVPPESLATAQRTQTEGHSLPITPHPAVRAVALNLSAPGLDDLRSDAERVRAGLELPDLTIPLPVLGTLSNDLRAHDFHATAFLRGTALVGIRQVGTAALGLAVDLGTTKLAGYLVDLASGETLASAGAMNPQIAFGEDVMARISHAITRPEGGQQLQMAVVTALNDLARDLCARAGHTGLDILDAVVVGNTAMHHLFLGLPVRQLGLAPYLPAESAAVEVSARELGFDFAPGASLHLLPNIAGFVGADHVAMLLGSGMLDREGNVLGLDIGTNTEISLLAGESHYACSTASGPAFEGAHIRHGMRAAPGAIEKVLLRDGNLLLQTIDGRPPVGLCGSGILDLVAQLRTAGIITSRGGFTPGLSHPRLRAGGSSPEFIVAWADENEGREITFDRRDVNEVQLAKAAMRAGIDILLARAGIAEQEIDTVIIAGAFGTYLDVRSGTAIGMFPPLAPERFAQVGNAAGAGARMALLSMEKRKQAAEIARRVQYVELTIEKDFSARFARALLLE